MPPSRGRSRGDDVDLGRDGNGTLDALGDRAALRVEAMHAVDDGWVHARLYPQPVADMDALDDENLALELDLAFGIGAETTVSGGDVARLERAPERADQSTGRGGDDVVEGGGVWRRVARGHPVVFGDLTVDAERYLLLLCGQRRVPERALDPFDADPRAVDHLAHGRLPSGLSAPGGDRGLVVCLLEVDRTHPCYAGELESDADLRVT
jgi:hypothetical protein